MTIIPEHMYKSFENDLTTTFYYSLPHFGSSTQPVPIGYLKCPGVGTKCHILRLKKDDIKKLIKDFQLYRFSQNTRKITWQNRKHLVNWRWHLVDVDKIFYSPRDWARNLDRDRAEAGIPEFLHNSNQERIKSKENILREGNPGWEFNYAQDMASIKQWQE